MNKLKLLLGLIPAAVLAGAVSLIQPNEGRSLTAYKDPVGIPTICDGETAGVYLGQVKTNKECDALTQARVKQAAADVQRIAGVPLTDGEWIAYTSFVYNAGPSTFQRSTLLKKLQAGDRKGACQQLPRFVYAKGVKLRGLVKRRAQEQAVCLKSL